MNVSPSPRASLWVARATLVAVAVLVGLALSSAAGSHRSGAMLPAQLVWWAAVAAIVDAATWHPAYVPYRAGGAV